MGAGTAIFRSVTGIIHDGATYAARLRSGQAQPVLLGCGSPSAMVRVKNYEWRLQAKHSLSANADRLYKCVWSRAIHRTYRFGALGLNRQALTEVCAILFAYFIRRDLRRAA